MQTHHRLTALGAFLLAVTYLLHYHYPQESPWEGFRYEYITGIGMLFAFAASFFLFHKNWKKSG